DGLAGDDLRRYALDGLRRDREADALVAAARALDLRRDADDLALEAEQHPAGVSVVDRGVRLDRVLDRHVVGRDDLAADRADDTARHRVVQLVGIADRDDAVTDLDD